MKPMISDPNTENLINVVKTKWLYYRSFQQQSNTWLVASSVQLT